MANTNNLTESARAVVREAMQGQPLRLQGLAETLAARGCGVGEIKRQVESIAKSMNVENSPRCPHCHTINTTAHRDGWRCLSKGCLAKFTNDETTRSEAKA